MVCLADAAPNAEPALEDLGEAIAAAAAASGGTLCTPIAPFGRPWFGRGALGFESGLGGASDPQGTAGLGPGLSAGRSRSSVALTSGLARGELPEFELVSCFAAGAAGS